MPAAAVQPGSRQAGYGQAGRPAGHSISITALYELHCAAALHKSREKVKDAARKTKMSRVACEKGAALGAAAVSLAAVSVSE